MAVHLTRYGKAVVDQITAALRYHYFTDGGKADEKTMARAIKPELLDLIDVYETAIQCAELEAANEITPSVNAETMRRLFMRDFRAILIACSLHDGSDEDDQIFFDEMGPQVADLLAALEWGNRYVAASREERP